MMNIPIRDIQLEQRPLRIIQISDAHLFADTSACLLGMNTERSFRQVIEKIQQENPSIDLVLATGDLAQSPAVDTYHRFYQHVAQLGAPQFWLQGNHDLDRLFCDRSEQEDCMSPVILTLGNWRIIMLNSSVDHEVAGRFSSNELNWLRAALQQCAGYHCIVALHHHPLPVGSYWLDQHMLSNTLPFWQIIDQFDNIKAILHGHVHQHVDTMYGDVRILACPSTCIQFKPNSQEFALDDLPPGYRWLTLYPSGELQTAVERLDKTPEGVDFNSLGY